MYENFPWYTIVTGPGLLQGDVIYDCPVLVPFDEIPEGNGGNEYALEGELLTYDVIVMSQSCDLEQEKLDLVLVCPHWSVKEFTSKNDYLRSSKGKTELKRGNIPGYHLLNKCDLGAGRKRLAWWTFAVYTACLTRFSGNLLINAARG
jgi:hypothetical protein